MTAEEYYELASSHFEKGMDEEARICLEKAVQLNPDWEKPYNLIGRYYKGKEDFESAVRYYQKAFEINPTWAIPLANIGNCLLETGQFDSAIEYFQRAIKIDPEWAYPYLRMGESYGSLHKLVKAEECFIKAHELRPDWDEACLGMGKVCAARLNYSLAIEFFQKAIDITPDLKEAYCHIGESYRRQNKFAEAKSNFLRAKKIDEQYPNAYLGLLQLPDRVFEGSEQGVLSYLSKYLLLPRPSVLRISIRRILESCINLEAPLLIYSILENEIEDEDEQMFITTDLQEAARLVKPFRQQFAIWEQKRKSSGASLLVEAIMNFYLGNAIRACQILDNEIEETADAPLPLIGQYYSALSADMILEDRKEYLEYFLVPNAREAIENDSYSFTDKYYAALILDLAGHTTEAADCLKFLDANGFAAAMYKSAEISGRYYDSEIAFEKEIISELCLRDNLDDRYFRLPSKIILTDDEDKMLGDLMPLIHFMENRRILEQMYAYRSQYKITGTINPYDQRYFFANHIVFSHLEDQEKLYKYLKASNPFLYSEIYGSDEERHLIEPEINLYKSYKNNSSIRASEALGDVIHKAAFADYSYIKQNYKLPPKKFNFRHFLLLVFNLQKEEVITTSEAVFLHEYIKYCAEMIFSASPESELKKLALSELKGHLLPTAAFIGLGWGSVEEITKFVYYSRKGKDSDIIAFPEFCHKTGMEDYGS